MICISIVSTDNIHSVHRDSSCKLGRREKSHVTFFLYFFGGGGGGKFSNYLREANHAKTCTA